MHKTEIKSNYETKLFLLILLLILAGYLYMTSKTDQSGLKEPQPVPAETINDANDLQKAQDKLNSVNVDSVDQGLNQLNTDTSTF